MSNVLLEAASSGRPVLASDISGCRETFDDGKTGIGFQPRNTESLYDAIVRFAEMTAEERAEMGRRGREKMQNEFDRQRVVEAYKEKIALYGGRK